MVISVEVIHSESSIKSRSKTSMYDIVVYNKKVTQGVPLQYLKRIVVPGVVSFLLVCYQGLCVALYKHNGSR